MGEWAAVMAFAATYNIQDSKVINDVAMEISHADFASPADLRQGIVKAFDKHGIHMV
mgnify:FL=1|jgi:hypothetical protein